MPTAEEYAKLAKFLKTSTEKEIVLSIKNVEQIIGVPLPKSARNFRQWWENDLGHTQAKNGWLDVGWETFRVEMEKKRVPFRKKE